MSPGRRSLGGLVFPFWSRAVTVAAQVISGDGCVGGCGIVCVVVGRSRARVRRPFARLPSSFVSHCNLGLRMKFHDLGLQVSGCGFWGWGFKAVCLQGLGWFVA